MRSSLAFARRGLTMIEMLLALVLLASIVAATASWTTLAGRLGAQTVEPMRREAVIEAVFTLIHDDLVTGDFLAHPRDRKSSSRVSVQDGAVVGEMVIETRVGCKCIYRFDRLVGRLERVEQSRNSHAARPLIDGIVDFSCTLHDDPRLLDVAIDFTRDDPEADYALPAQRFVRRFHLP